MDVRQSGRDHAGEQIDVFYDGHTFPFSDSEFETVICFEVLDHAFEPVRFLGEIGRDLRAGGTLLVTVPFEWDEHEQPFDFARYSSFGLRHLIEAHGFTILETAKTCADVRVLFQLVNAYLFKVAEPVSFLPITLAPTAPVTLAGLVAHRLAPANSELYLDDIILGRKRGVP